ncbi:Ca2+-binding protein, EF-hand superfamily [Lentzea albidocapillata subsp. violacea]|uniref:Ca2+-binding protein, EF-hand superfamily n=1 Tax=Lentzea albidocapillata subsp. violacea TaxID=128104 RepID=A0A1G8SK97_9PSEU|nr:EF-hand domain-containing protein [Lentzea albidocapillata]SDJ29594.1 Ca2+-binding protein, EF-hand superfamily [Lentzea albidocapillata subsp. violacea]
MTAAVKNDRLKKRFAKWDVNKNGRIEKADYEAEARRIVKAFGEDPASPQARAVINSFSDMFEYLASKAGVGPNGSMTEQQFIEVTEAQIFQEGDSGFNRVVRPTIAAIVGLCDTDGDGEVNPREFGKWLDAIGVEPSAVDTAFRAIDVNGNGKLTVDELVHAVRDYHLGKLDVPLLGN